MADRLTRAESQARTRRLVMDAAVLVFAQKGFAGASMEEIAAAAGFSRGAVYSNFTDKADLFLAVLEDRERRRVGQVQAILEEAESPLDFFAKLAVSDRYRADEETRTWTILGMEFWLYAMRDDQVRQRLAERDRTIRGWLASGVEAVFSDTDAEPPLPLVEVAAVVHAMDEGLALQRLVDPDSIRADLFLTAVGILQQALVDDR